MDGWVAVLTALGGLVGGGLGTWLLTYLSKRYEWTRQSRRDAVDEWKEISMRTQERYEADQAKARERVDALVTEVVALRSAISECERNKAEQAVAIADLKGDIRLLQASMRREQARHADEISAIGPVAIIAGLDGIMRSVSPAVGPLLHYLPDELVGQSIEKIIPERLRQEHRDALARVAATGQLPWSERVILSDALTRDNREVPVTITLSGWRTSGGEQFVSAEIQRRTG